MIQSRFQLHQHGDGEWMVKDHRYADHDPRQLVVRVIEYAEGEVEALWIRDLPLATQYCSAREVLDDIESFYRHNGPLAPGPLTPDSLSQGTLATAA